MAEESKHHRVSLLVPDSQKDAAWHKDYHNFIIGLAQAQSKHLHEIQANLLMMHGEIDENDYVHLYYNNDGNLLPMDMIPLNRVKRFVNQIEGEVAARKIKPEIKPLSRAAVSYRRSKELDIKADYKMRPMAMIEEQEYGLPLIQEGTPATLEELENKLSNYKDEGQILYSRIMEDIIAKNNLSSMRNLCARTGIWAGRAHVRVCVENGQVVIKNKDPRFVIVDRDCEDNGKGMSWWIEWNYIPVHQARAMGMSDDDIEECKSSGGMLDVSGARGFIVAFPNASFIDSYTKEEMVLWTRVEWMDSRQKVGLKYKGKGGKELYSIKDADFGMYAKENQAKVKKDMKSAEEAKDIPVQMWRHCEMIGLKYIVSYGEVENQPRSYETWPLTSSTMTSFMPQWIRFEGNVPMMSEVRGLQRIFNETWQYIRRAMNRDKGPQITRDKGFTPENMSDSDVNYIMDTIGEVLFDTSKYLGSIGQPPVGMVDLSIRQGAVQAYATVLAMINQEMEIITGIGTPRMGGVIDPNTRVGVNDAAQIQSRIQTLWFFYALEDFISSILTTAANLYRMLIVNDPDAYSHIIGDDMVEWVKKHKDFDTFDYGFHVGSLQIPEETKNLVRKMAMDAVAANALPFDEGVMAVLEESPYEAIKQLKDRIEKRAKEAKAIQEQQMAMQQAQQDQMAEIEASKMQQDYELKNSELDLNAAQASANLQLAAARERNNLQNGNSGGRSSVLGG